MESAKAELEPLLQEEEGKIKDLEEQREYMKYCGEPDVRVLEVTDDIIERYSRLITVCEQEIPLLDRNWKNREVDEPFLEGKINYYERKRHMLRGW